MAPLQPFAVLAKRLTRTEQKKAADIQLLKEVGKFEVEQDECSAYCSMVPHEGNQTTIAIFESYESEDYLQDDQKGHKSSKEYRYLKETEVEDDRLETPTQVGFYRVVSGYLQRENVPSVPIGEQFIWIAKLTANPGKRDEIIAACKVHAENVERTEESTYSFVVLESTENDVDLLLFERYASERYFKDVHSTSETMKEYRGKIGPVLAGRDSEGYRVVAGFLDKRETLH